MMTAAAVASLLLVAIYVDLILSSILSKRIHLYPATFFFCPCGYHQRLFAPIQLYHFFKAYRHMRNCLVWIMQVDAEGITPYYGSIRVARGDSLLDTAYWRMRSKEDRLKGW